MPHFKLDYKWRTLIAAQLGWMLDGMDVMLYAFALPQIRAEFGLSAGTAGALASVTLLTSAAGGIWFGMLADRIGRARSLALSILFYSVFTALTATANNLAVLVLWRALVGVGLGGEWSAGSVLVAESWPAEHRGKAIGFMQAGWAIGYILAALLAAAILPHYGWRPLFVIGVAPALLAFWIRLAVPEPPSFTPRRHAPIRAVLSRTLGLAVMLTTAVQFAYWGLFTWIPTYLSSPVALGGAGLSMFKSSAWIVPMQTGAFFGYLSFGFFADRWGRRPVFIVFVLAAAVLVPLFGSGMLWLGPLLGFFGHGYFSVFGALLAELFPSAIRATAQGLSYNLGRAAGALAPFTIGAIAGHFGIGAALGLTSVFFTIAAGLILLLPETRGGELT